MEKCLLQITPDRNVAVVVTLPAKARQLPVYVDTGYFNRGAAPTQMGLPVEMSELIGLIDERTQIQIRGFQVGQVRSLLRFVGQFQRQIAGHGANRGLECTRRFEVIERAYEAGVERYRSELLDELVERRIGVILANIGHVDR